MTQKSLKILTGTISISLPLALVILFSLGYLRSEILGLVSLIIIGELILYTWFLIHFIYREDTRINTRKNENKTKNQLKISQSGPRLIIEKEVVNN